MVYGSGDRPVSNPVITNTTTGEFLQSIQTLNAGDTLTISTKPRACTATYTPAGGSATNAMKTMSLNSTFFLLPPGITNVTYASSLNIQSGSSMELTWNDRGRRSDIPAGNPMPLWVFDPNLNAIGIIMDTSSCPGPGIFVVSAP